MKLGNQKTFSLLFCAFRFLVSRVIEKSCLKKIIKSGILTNYVPERSTEVKIFRKKDLTCLSCWQFVASLHLSWFSLAARTSRPVLKQTRGLKTAAAQTRSRNQTLNGISCWKKTRNRRMTSFCCEREPAVLRFFFMWTSLRRQTNSNVQETCFLKTTPGPL